MHKIKKRKGKAKKFFTGVVSITRSGLGFVAHESLEEDILIDRELVGTALNGDEVEVLVLPSARKGRANGKVLKVLKRARTRFVGALRVEGSKMLLVPDNQRINTDFNIPAPPTAARDGLKALVEMDEWLDAEQQPTAKIIDVLGKAGEHETEMQAILLERDFQDSFPMAVQQEAEQVQAKWSRSLLDHLKREDFRDVLTCTIDPVDAKDYDDALSVRELNNGNYEIGIHIADVTHFIKVGSALDKEARKRATSVYLVDRTIPMLPEELSNDICSLKEGVERFAFSAIFELDKNATVQNLHFAKTIIKSDKRFSYQEAQNILDNDAAKDPLSTSIKILRDLARKMRAQRVKDGTIEFETDEIAFELDENKKPIRAFVKEKLETMKIVEEFMLLTNSAVAKYIATHCKDSDPRKSTFIYRIHGEPDAAKIEELRIFLRALGHDQLGHKSKQIKSSDIAELIRAVKGTPEEAVVQTATLRSMAKAVYTHKNIGHFSLGFKHYTHFTSPIRRYPDIMVHRILKAHLDGTIIPKKEMDGYIKMAITASAREVEAVAAERESVKFKQVEYMSNLVGKTFTGTITGVTKSGFFVAEDETRAEGFISASSLKDDWYELDEKSYALVGKQKKKSFRIGNSIKIKLKRASLEDRQIDWELV